VHVIALTAVDCPSSITIRYYVEMPKNPTILASNHEDDLVVNLEYSNHVLDDLSAPSQTQEAPKLLDLLLLPRLPTRRTQGKEPLVDYSNSHVITL